MSNTDLIMLVVILFYKIQEILRIMLFCNAITRAQKEAQKVMVTKRTTAEIFDQPIRLELENEEHDLYDLIHIPGRKKN